MATTPSVLISAATLTADEVATCYRNNYAFRELAILFVRDGKNRKRAALAVGDAFAAGAEHVWEVLPHEECLITTTDRGVLGVKDYDDEFTPTDFPNFRCRVRDFVDLLEHPGSSR